MKIQLFFLSLGMEKNKLFYDHVSEVLSGASFVKDKAELKWTRIETQQTAEMQVIVNGQTQTVPGQTVKTRITVESTGEGSVDGREFAQVRLIVERTGQETENWVEQVQIPDECIFFDEPEYFDYWITHC